jgi:serine/threonine-protein kinase
MTALVAGTVLEGRYRLDHELGRGSSAVVWAAVDQERGRSVALKVLLSETPVALGRFRREARALLSLDHPGIVRVTEVVADGAEIAAIAMELLRGETLRDRLRRETSLPAAQCARLLSETAAAITYAHDRGVLHRDLKPENVFLCAPESRAVLLDFGLARWLEAEGAAPRTGSIVTEHGVKLGTLPYMAPELLTEGDPVDEAADAWSLGVLLYECLTGFRPFDGQSEAELMRRILFDAIAPVTFVAPEVPAALTGLIDRLLSRDRTERAATLRDVAGLLAKHAAEGG